MVVSSFIDMVITLFVRKITRKAIVYLSFVMCVIYYIYIMTYILKSNWMIDKSKNWQSLLSCFSRNWFLVNVMLMIELLECMTNALLELELSWVELNLLYRKILLVLGIDFLWCLRLLHWLYCTLLTSGRYST